MSLPGARTDHRTTLPRVATETSDVAGPADLRGVMVDQLRDWKVV
ncbi:MAG: hypothetical protein ACRDRT_14215 [Pseudonocardiaceae bacterium]